MPQLTQDQATSTNMQNRLRCIHVCVCDTKTTRIVTNLFHQAHSQRMQLYMANFILSDKLIPLTTHGYTTTAQTDTRKRNTSATEGTGAEPISKRMRQTNGEDTKEDITKAGVLTVCIAQCTKLKARRGLNRKKTRITGVTTRPTDLAPDGKLETTGHASRDMARLVQMMGHISALRQSS